jgi:hypothetical protein
MLPSKVTRDAALNAPDGGLRGVMSTGLGLMPCPRRPHAVGCCILGGTDGRGFGRHSYKTEQPCTTPAKSLNRFSRRRFLLYHSLGFGAELTTMKPLG